jgi:hypothetical protein
MLATECLLVDLLDTGHDAACREVHELAARGIAHALTEKWGGEDTLQGVREGYRIAVWDEDACVTVIDEVRNAAVPRSNYRPPGGQLLGDSVARPS